MRNFTKSHKLQADSLVEIKRGLIRASESLTDSGARYNTRPIKPGNLLNALVVWFLRQSPADQSRIAREGLASLQQIQDSETAVAIAHSVGGPFESHLALDASILLDTGAQPKGVNRIARTNRRPKR